MGRHLVARAVTRQSEQPHAAVVEDAAPHEAVGGRDVDRRAAKCDKPLSNAGAADEGHVNLHGGDSTPPPAGSR